MDQGESTPRYRYEKNVGFYFRCPFILTRSRPAMATAPMTGKGESGDFVSVGQGVGTVIAAMVVRTCATAVGTAVIAVVAGAVTVKVALPIYPLVSEKSTAYCPPDVTTTFWVKVPAPVLRSLVVPIHCGPNIRPFGPVTSISTPAAPSCAMEPSILSASSRFWVVGDVTVISPERSTSWIRLEGD